MDEDTGANLLMFTVAIFCIVLGGWVIANYEPQRTGIIFVALALLGLLLLMFGVFSDGILNIDDDSEGPEITKGELGVQAVGGIFAGIVPIIISLVTPLSIGLPIIALSLSGKIFVSVFVAPPIEEFFFLMLAIAIYKLSMKSTDESRGISIAITLLVVPVVFAAYHWFAYGATWLVAGAFIGAAVFRLLTLLIVLAVSAADGEPGFSVQTVAPVILVVIIMHMLYNAFIFAKTLSIG